MAENEVNENRIEFPEELSSFDPMLDTASADDPRAAMRRKQRKDAAEEKREAAAKKKRKKTGWFVFVLFALVVTVVFVLADSFVTLSRLNTEKARVQNELSELNRQIELNKATLEQVNSDEYVEQQARSQYKMIRDGEVLYVVEGGYDSKD